MFLAQQGNFEAARARPRMIVPHMRALPLLLVAAVTLVAHLGVLGCDFVNWDDDLVLLRNEHLRGLSPEHVAWMFSSAHMGHYQPLTWLTYAVDHALWGLAPLPFHAVNLAWHVAAALACYGLLAEMLRHVASGGAARARWLAAFGALVFAVHPLRVESVAWVTERRDVVSGLFWMLTVWSYLRAHRDGDIRSRGRWLWLSHALLVLSLLGKAWGVTMGVVLCLVDVAPLQRHRHVGLLRLVAEKWGYLAIGLGFAVVAAIAQESGGARMALSDHPWWARLVQACFGLCYYAEKTLLPIRLSPLVPFERAIDLAEMRFLVTTLAVALGAVGAVLAWHRLPRTRGAIVAALAAGVILAPVLGFLQSGPQLVADRYTYLAAVPFSAVLVVWLARAHARVVAAVAIPWLGVLGALTWQQTRVWRDSHSLWEHTLRLQPESFNARFQYGRALQAAGDAAGARREYEQAVALQPREHKAWYALGVLRYRGGDALAAHRDLLRAVDLAPSQRDYLYMAALSGMDAGQLDAALGLAQRARAVDPAWPHAPHVEGDCLLRLGRRDEARKALERALALDPGNAAIRQRLEQAR